MKRVCICWKCIRASLCKIHMIDKFLIIIMTILLSQSAYNLFMNHAATGEAGSIDVIVRTSTAAIFGYFLSTNFIRHESVGTTVAAGSVRSIPATGGGEIQSRIGFSDSGADTAEGLPAIGSASRRENPKEYASAASCIQVVAASLIGIFCLVTLLIWRNMTVLEGATGAAEPALVTATVAQFRDIVSGCIGFLIGCPTTASSAD